MSLKVGVLAAPLHKQDGIDLGVVRPALGKFNNKFAILDAFFGFGALCLRLALVGILTSI